MTWQDERDEIFRRMKPVLGEKALNRFWTAYVTSSDPKTKTQILGVLQLLSSKHLKAAYAKPVLLPPPSAAESAGDHELGRVVYAGRELHPFGLREAEWLRHVGIFGTTGSGKTNCAFIILSILRLMGKPFLVFDWKRNYRDLLALDNFRGTNVYTIGRNVSPLFFNPLIPPPGIDARSWLKKLSEILAHSYFLGEGVLYLLQNAFDKAYADYGVYSGASEYPTFRDVLAILEKMEVKGRKALWMDSTLRTLGVLCFGEFGRVLNVSRPPPIDKLLAEDAVLELDALTNSDKTFFIEALLLWIHHYRMAQGEREVFKHAILIEESHHVLLRKKQEMTGSEAITDIILREIRELGEAIVLLDQHPSLISLPALGNTYTTICFNLKHRVDMLTMADSLLLSRDEADFLGQLETGTAIAKLQGRYFLPFLVRISLFPIRKGFVSDSDLMRRNPGRSDESEVIRLEKGLKSLVRSLEGLVKEGGEATVLGAKERQFLEDIAKHPVSGVVARYARLGINRYQGNRIQSDLIEKKLITWRGVSTATGRLKVLVFTDAGKKAIPDVRIEKAYHKNESYEHAVAKAKVAEHYRALGYEVTMEYKLPGGRAVDVVAEKDGKRIAIEIETGKSDSLYNIRKDVKAGFDEVLIIPTCKRTKSNIEEALRRSGMSGNDRTSLCS